MIKTVIMAGGKGKRIRSVYPDIPKPLIPIGDKTIIEHEIECLRRQGVTDFVITVAYMADKIMSYLGNGSKLGVNIKYYIEEQPMGNAGALYELDLKDDFLLINADSFFDVDITRFIHFHKEMQGLATIFTHPNSHPFDSGVVISKGGCVEKWLSKEEPRPQWFKNRVNAGIHILSPFLLRNKPNSFKIDLDCDILKPLAGTGKLFCYDSPEYVKDMGTPERLESVLRDYTTGKVHNKNLKNKQKAIFLDRDGTVNKYVGFLNKPEDLELLPTVAKAVKRINDSGYLAIIITNQPVVARGEVTIENLELIHNKLEILLAEEGAYLDDIVYCPHHPDKGYPGEVPFLKIECECRKPKPGMLLKAAEKFNINLFESWMIGDSDTDIQAGRAAGCSTIKIGKNDLLSDVIDRIL